MTPSKSRTDSETLKHLGERLARRRLAQNLTQAALAKEAGLGVRTVQRLEHGEAATHLAGFVRVCRVLGLAERLDLLVPAPSHSEMELMEHLGESRRRASKARGTRGESTGWTWADSP